MTTNTASKGAMTPVADWTPNYDNRGGDYNVSGWGLRCKNCGAKLTHARYTADGWDAEHIGWRSTSEGWCDDPAPLPAANVGKSAHKGWALLDSWGNVWDRFPTRDAAARYAYKLVRDFAIENGTAPRD